MKNLICSGQIHNGQHGSSKATVNRKETETKCIAAMQAYLKSNSILSDIEFDTLKRELKEHGSQFAF